VKIKELQKKLREKGIDAALLYNMETNEENPNMRYLANYKGYGFLIVPAKKRPFLVAPLMDIEYLLKSGMKFYLMKKNFMEKIKKKLRNPRKIGVEARNFSIFALKKFRKHFKAKFIDVSELIEELRITKTKEEIKIIKEASGITNGIINRCIGNFGKFRTEKDVERFLKIECIKNNVEPSFNIIVASGISPATPHHIPSNKPLRRGFCVIDFGIRYKGYCTDVTRTVFIGSPSEKEKRMYSLVLSVQEKAIEKIKIGMNYSELDDFAKKEFGKYAKRFIHSLGHGLGIEVHESSMLYDKNQKIENGMYFTIEPGLYFPLRFGIRIEDDIFIHRGKVIDLTTVSKQLVCIKPKNF